MTHSETTEESQFRNKGFFLKTMVTVIMVDVVSNARKGHNFCKQISLKVSFTFLNGEFYLQTQVGGSK